MAGAYFMIKKIPENKFGDLVIIRSQSCHRE